MGCSVARGHTTAPHLSDVLTTHQGSDLAANDLAPEQVKYPLAVWVSTLSGESLAKVDMTCSSTGRDLVQRIIAVAGIESSLGLDLVHGGKTIDLDSSLAELGFQSSSPNRVTALFNESPTFEFEVLANDHVHGPRERGMYFHFAREAIAGLEPKATLRGSLVNTRTGESGEAVLWGNANGGSFGDAHGRFDPFSERRSGQFHVGDVLRFSRKRKSSHKIRVLADDHAHGPAERGKYFHFSRDDVEALGHEHFLLGQITNARSGERCRAILWGRANGGSEGDAHGRFDPPSRTRIGQFQRGDELHFEVG